jgi:hypothetical protein
MVASQTSTTTATTPTTTATTATDTTTTSTSTTATTPYDTTVAAGCADGSASGLAAEDTFLQTWVPKIEASAAYKKDGVIVIAFTGDGGKNAARTGALVLSRWTHKGKTISTSYGPYSVLRSMEDMLDLQPLAHAATAPSFAASVL